MADPIKKKADPDASTVAILSIDSPGTVTATDLETLGLTSVTFSTGIAVGGGGGSEPPPADLADYVAICDAVFHSPDVLGALPGGVWMGNFHDDAREAFSEAAAHEDGFAVVKCRVGQVLLGPINPF